MKMHNDPSEIKILTGMDAVRMRPNLYLGHLDNVLIPNILLREALCCARDEALQGRCKTLDIRIDEDGCATIRDDGSGLPLEMGPCGKRKAEAYLTSIHAGCAAGKSSEEIARTTCVLTLAVLNAFSAELKVRIFANGSEWCQDYREGNPVAPMKVVRTTVERGTELSFRLDSSILMHREFDFSEFNDWVAGNVTALSVNIHDLRTNEIVNIHS